MIRGIALYEQHTKRVKDNEAIERFAKQKAKEEGVEKIDLVVADGIIGLEGKVLKHYLRPSF